MNELEKTKQWFEQAIPEPTIESTCVQIGCAYEETLEVTMALNTGMDLQHELGYEAARFKNSLKCVKSDVLALSENQKIELLDGIVDEIVTRVGIGHNMGFDILGALAEVNRSNFSKFENGIAVFDENGKIKKGEHYTPPELKRFI